MFKKKKTNESGHDKIIFKKIKCSLLIIHLFTAADNNVERCHIISYIMYNYFNEI